MDISKRDGRGGRLWSFKEFKLENGTVIGVFQGSRGENPDLDIIVKYKEPGKQVRTPKHIHWAIDLLLKRQQNEELTKDFAQYLLNMWNAVEPFRTKEDQSRCELSLSGKEDLSRFIELDDYGEYSVEFIAKVLELIMIQEKTGLSTAFMFRGVLKAIHDEGDIFSIVSAASYSGSLR